MGTLVPANIQAPGFYGINRQVVIAADFRWAFDATNAVIDANGRMAARHGRKHLTTTALTGIPKLRALAEHITTAGNSTIVSAANNKLYTGTGTMTDATGTAAGVTGITADHWQFQNTNGRFVGFQDGHDPVYRTTGNFSLLQQELPAWTAGTAYAIGDCVRATSGNQTIYFHCTTDGTSHASTEPTWDTAINNTTTDNTVTWTTRKFPNGNVCHSAFGRLWVTSSGDKTVLEFSDTLLPAKFRGGLAGTLDVKTLWAGDEIIAVSSYSDLLVIFGRKTILLYTGATDPTTMALAEKIEGVGAIARDSVQTTGNDIVFLSDSGIRSLSRTVTAGGKAPLNDLSRNVRDYFMGLVASETPANIKSVYHEPDGFYIVTLPTAGLEFVLDFRFPNPDGSAKVTTWSGFGSTSLLSARDRTLYVGYTGVVAQYTGYSDDQVQGDLSSITGTFKHSYRSTWVNFGDESAQRFKFLKHVRAIVSNAATYVITFFFGADFDESGLSQVATAVNASGNAQWGVAQWNLDNWSGSGTVYTSVRVHPTGHGSVIKIGWDVTINGAQIAFQELNILAKLGRLT